jgi:hypothetical protein
MGDVVTAETPRPTVEQLAAEPVDRDDVDLLRQVGQLYQHHDPVPDGLVERLQFAITLDALHAEIAQLERMQPELSGARSDSAGATEVQTVTFTSASLTTMITITPAGPKSVRIDGWVAPGEGARVELRIVGGHQDVVADEDGRFVFDDVPRGLAQFVVRPRSRGQQAPVITPSLEL